ncbi:bifunctional DNA primase/polymerase [Pengzhenrongella sp.]|jgi:hypothetical protein|uniref:bifunctional DNA primase/polymerase n=1 Tax=Pengzhenrongella sp. TaxID=2888820 RepID=UPI002F95344E
MSPTVTRDLLAAALTYAERGWRVFPLRPNDKRPACPAHPADRCDQSDPFCRTGHTGWQDRATTDEARITRAWSSRPYGIGIATGPSALVVVDTDVPKPAYGAPDRGRFRNVSTGEDVLAALADEHGAPVKATYTVRTRSGGSHRYYAHPVGPRLANTTGSLGRLIDTRAHGGYVVAAPTTIDAATYTISDDQPPAPLPDWLSGLLRPVERPPHATIRAARPRALPVDGDRSARYVAAALDGEIAKVRGAQAGTRNHALFCAALALGQLVAGGALALEVARDALLDSAAAHITAGAFTHREALASIASGLRRGANNPRTRAA